MGAAGPGESKGAPQHGVVLGWPLSPREAQKLSVVSRTTKNRMQSGLKVLRLEAAWGEYQYPPVLGRHLSPANSHEHPKQQNHLVPVSPWGQQYSQGECPASPTYDFTYTSPGETCSGAHSQQGNEPTAELSLPGSSNSTLLAPK